MMPVTKRPVKTAVNLLPETTLKSFCNLFPAPFCIPLLNKSIPQSKRARAPTKLKMIDIIESIIVVLFFKKYNNCGGMVNKY